LAVRLLLLVGMVFAVQSELSTLRMRSWRTRVFQNGVVADAVKLGLSLLVQRGKDRRLRNLVGSVASGDAFDASLNPVDADMPAEALSPPAHKRLKKARVDRG
jgi:hypothetical protein